MQTPNTARIKQTLSSVVAGNTTYRLYIEMLAVKMGLSPQKYKVDVQISSAVSVKTGSIISIKKIYLTRGHVINVEIVCVEPSNGDVPKRAQNAAMPLGLWPAPAVIVIDKVRICFAPVFQNLINLPILHLTASADPVDPRRPPFLVLAASMSVRRSPRHHRPARLIHGACVP